MKPHAETKRSRRRRDNIEKYILNIEKKRGTYHKYLTRLVVGAIPIPAPPLPLMRPAYPSYNTIYNQLNIAPGVARPPFPPLSILKRRFETPENELEQ